MSFIWLAGWFEWIDPNYSQLIDNDKEWFLTILIIFTKFVSFSIN